MLPKEDSHKYTEKYFYKLNESNPKTKLRNIKVFKSIIREYLEYKLSKVFYGEIVNFHRAVNLGRIGIVKRKRLGKQVDFGATNKLKRELGKDAPTVFRTNKEYMSFNWFKLNTDFPMYIFKMAWQHERAIPKHEKILKLNVKLYK